MHALERRIAKLEPARGQRLFVAEASDNGNRDDLDRLLAEAGATDLDLAVIIRRYDETPRAPRILYIQEQR